MMNRARTIADAQAQEFVVPDTLDNWRKFAGMIDGYEIAQELGLNFGEWGAECERQYADSGKWNLDVLELRLMLFYQFRADYMGGYTYHERDHLVESLLHELRTKVSESK